MKLKLHADAIAGWRRPLKRGAELVFVCCSANVQYTQPVVWLAQEVRKKAHHN
jgi:hypothetical protein